MSAPASNPPLFALLTADGLAVRWRAMLGGALIAFLVALTSLELMVTNPEFWFMSGLISASGLIGGALMCGWIGHTGTRGFWLSLLGCVLSGIIGGAIGGTVLLPGFGTVAGALLGASLPVRSFSSFVIWAACCTVLHKVLERARRAV